jgi:nicotinamidase/pyrazinamidase
MAGSSVSYNPTTALVVVDLQNDFADPAGLLHVAGGEDLLDAVNAEIAAARAGGAPVVFTQDWHPPQTPHFQNQGGVWPVHCVRDTWGAELVDGLDVADAPVVRKGTGGEDGYSGFTMRDPVTGDDEPTGLDAILRRSGVTAVVVTGLALDVCVRATALDGLRLGYEVTVLGDLSRPVERQPGDGERAAAELRSAGANLV